MTHNLHRPAVGLPQRVLMACALLVAVCWIPASSVGAKQLTHPSVRQLILRVSDLPKKLRTEFSQNISQPLSGPVFAGDTVGSPDAPIQEHGFVAAYLTSLGRGGHGLSSITTLLGAFTAPAGAHWAFTQQVAGLQPGNTPSRDRIAILHGVGDEAISDSFTSDIGQGFVIITLRRGPYLALVTLESDEKPLVATATQITAILDRKLKRVR